MPFHEREVQRPAGLADDRQVLELVLEEEARERRAAMQHIEQQDDIDPGLMIADQQPAAFRVQRSIDLDAPIDRIEGTQEDSVGADPGIGDRDQDAGTQAAPGRNRHQQLQQDERNHQAESHRDQHTQPDEAQHRDQ